MQQYLLDRINQAMVSGQNRNIQRQSRDVKNTRQGSRSQAQVHNSKVRQSGVKHRDSRMKNAQKCQPGQEQDFAVSKLLKCGCVNEVQV